MILRVSVVEDRRLTDFSWWALREVRMGRGRLSWKLTRERLTVRNGQMLQRKRVLWGYEEFTCVVLTFVIFQNSTLLTEAFPSNMYRHL